MNLSPAEQYDEVISALPRSPISNQGEKYYRFEKTSRILHDIFTPDIWNEWDSNLERLKKCYQKKIDVNEYDKDYNLVYK